MTTNSDTSKVRKFLTSSGEHLLPPFEDSPPLEGSSFLKGSSLFENSKSLGESYFQRCLRCN